MQACSADRCASWLNLTDADMVAISDVVRTVVSDMRHQGIVARYLVCDLSCQPREMLDFINASHVQ